MGDDSKKEAFEKYMAGSTKQLTPDMPPEPTDEGPGDAEFHISLTATACNQDQANRLFAKFSATALDVAHDSVSQMVSSHKFGDSEDGFLEGEFYNERTMFKVLDALRQADVDEAHAHSIINELLNAGIMFRERR